MELLLHVTKISSLIAKVRHKQEYSGWWVTQLSKRELHISNFQSLTPKSQNDTLECTLEEMAVFKFLQSNPEAKQEDIAKPGQILKYRQEDNTNID